MSIISQRTGVITIAILLAATTAGWLMTEFVPPAFPQLRDSFVERWGETAVRVIEALRLYDPFHSFWYTGVLSLFFVVLLLCMASRAPEMLRGARVTAPGSAPRRSGGGRFFELDWPGPAVRIGDDRDPVAHFGKKYGAVHPPQPAARAEFTESLLGSIRRRGFRVARRDEDGKTLFRGVRGRWKPLWNLLFHAGLLVITIGGVIGSRTGTREILYGRRGDVIPVNGSGPRIRVDDFRIIMSNEGSVRDYVSELTVLGDDGEVLASGRIEVNHPMSARGYDIYQSSYSIAEDEYDRVRLRIAGSDSVPPAVLMLREGEPTPVPGTSMTLSGSRFIPDFRMGPGGPRSASGMMRNPAVGLRLQGPGVSRDGWVFLLHPDFSTRFPELGRVVIEEIEPVYYTGLEISRNPGAPVFLAGMMMTAAGVMLMYMGGRRTLTGRIDGRGILVRGAGGWKTAVSSDIDSIEKEARRLVGSLMQGQEGPMQERKR